MKKTTFRKSLEVLMKELNVQLGTLRRLCIRPCDGFVLTGEAMELVQDARSHLACAANDLLRVYEHLGVGE